MAFFIDGTEYEMPTFESFTIGESRILKRYTGAVGEQLGELDNSDPDMTAAMVHIAFKRENPALSFAAIERMVDDVKWVSMDFIADEEEVAEDDPPTQSATETSLDAEQPSSGESGTDNGEPSLENVSQLPSGLPASATSSTSDHQTSAT